MPEPRRALLLVPILFAAGSRMTDWHTPLDDRHSTTNGEFVGLICLIVRLFVWPIFFVKGVRKGLRSQGNRLRDVSDRDAINLHDGPIVITGVERDHG